MRKNMIRTGAAAAVVCALLAGSAMAFGQGPETGSLGVKVEAAAKKKEPSAPVFREASVHDPSVIKAGDTYYVFGSHLAAAKSKDLMKWDMIASGVAEGNPLIPNVTEELKDALAWAQSDTLWAADVIQLADGKFYMYYNACKGDSRARRWGLP